MTNEELELQKFKEMERYILDAYTDEYTHLDNCDIAPLLIDVFDGLSDTIRGEIEEIYEEIYGDASIIREDWMVDIIGCGMKGCIPNILTITQILNNHGLPYMYGGSLYNHAQGQLLRRSPNVEEMEGV